MANRLHSKESYRNYITFDDNNRTIELKESGERIPYENILGYKYVEEKGSMGKGALARAFSSSFFGDDHNVFVATKMQIEILLKDGLPKKRYINMIITPIKSNNMIYRSLKSCAEGILSRLEGIQPINRYKDGCKVDYSAELRKLKQLVDEGVITEEDYQAKKKQILGI